MGCRRKKSLIHASLNFFFYPYDQKLRKQTRSLPNQFEAILPLKFHQKYDFHM
jgi:hypothetical protein